ncbi:MAG: DUF1631 family protein [Gammaproteobacteria bacterium]
MKNSSIAVIDQSHARFLRHMDLLKSIFFSYFEQMIDAGCMRIDIELGLHLGKERDKSGKEAFKIVLDYLRSERAAIKKDYLNRVHEKIDNACRKPSPGRGASAKRNEIALASEGRVKEDYTAVMIIRDCEQATHELLTELNKLMSHVLGKPAFSNRQNPFAPEALVRALQAVLGPLTLDSDYRVALYKIFEAHVFSQLDLIYRELIKQCRAITEKEARERNQIKASFESACSNPESMRRDFQALQRQLDAWRAAQGAPGYALLSDNDHNYYEHFEISNALQVLAQFYPDDPQEMGGRATPLKRRVTKKLEELNFTGDLKHLDRFDEDMLDLIALTFDRIAQQEGLPAAVISALLALEIPLASASLGQYGVFVSRVQPVKQVLNDLYAAGLYLNLEHETDQKIYRKMLMAGSKIKQQTNAETGFWIALATEFSAYLAARQQAAREIEEAAIKRCEDQDEAALKKQHIVRKIQQGLHGKDIPPGIGEFLFNAWSDVLLSAYLAKESEPELWKRSRRTMNQLILSVRPPANDEQRKHILSFLPELIQDLRHGLQQINYDSAAQSRFFRELAEYHLLLASKKDIEDIAAEYPRVSAALPPHSAMIDDNHAEQARALAVQSWLVFADGPVKRWGRLAWKSQNTENMLFVGKNGEKIAEMTVDQLAEAFRKGLAEVLELDARSLIGQVLDEIAHAAS